jgi:ABC-type antimicrobial peptide transport system permease subunit
MFSFTYVTAELRRRLGRTVLTALGLAAGVAMVIAIVGVSDGLNQAQAQVLAPLRSVGTDILVTRVAGADTAAAGDATNASTSTTTTSPQRPGGNARGGGFFGGGGPGGQNDVLNQADATALLNENRSVVTDLSKLGEPGQPFTHDFFLSATLLSFPQSAIDDVAKIDGVTSATAGLTQLAQHQTGTVPQIVAEIQTGGETITQTVRPDPMTDAEREAFRQCLVGKGITIGGGGGGGPGGPGAVGGGGGPNAAFDECLPERFREFRAQVQVPLQTIQQVVNPPSTDIANESYVAGGVDPNSPDSGLVTRQQLSSGAWFSSDSAKEVLLAAAYASRKNLAVGSTLSINGTDLKVVGIVSPTLTGSTADVYFDLATLQQLAGKQDRVTQVLVKVDDAGQVDAVAAAIKQQLPGAEVVTTKAIADQVTGSLQDARNLADRLGGALAGIVLIAAFAIAALLTLGSVSKRVREIGTLRALGWSKRRVVGQLLAETTTIGVVGGILGVGFGILAAWGASALVPELTASSAGVPGLGTGSQFAQLFNQTQSATQSVSIHLHSVLHASTLVAGALFAVAGGLIAGLLGAWRAARLAPVVALRDLG